MGDLTVGPLTAGELTSLEICAGAGGQALGLEQAGFTHEAVVELDAAACETLRRNRGDVWKVIEDDVANVDGRGFAGTRPVRGRRALPAVLHRRQAARPRRRA